MDIVKDGERYPALIANEKLSRHKLWDCIRTRDNTIRGLQSENIRIKQAAHKEETESPLFLTVQLLESEWKVTCLKQEVARLNRYWAESQNQYLEALAKIEEQKAYLPDAIIRRLEP
tara:strand:+ start:120 stop:470 length:351 start_codon:yes stop_codon:yes gene_type:complete